MLQRTSKMDGDLQELQAILTEKGAPVLALFARGEYLQQSTQASSALANKRRACATI